MRIAALLLLTGLVCCGEDPASASAPASWEKQFRQGSEFLRHKNYPEARKCFQRATQLRPSYAEGFFYLGISALRSGDRPAAEAALRHAVLLNPRAVNALYNLGVLLLEDKLPSQAAEYFERAGKEGPFSQELAVNLIRARLEARQVKQAMAFVESTSRQFAGEAGFHLVTGKLLFEHGLDAASCSELSKANRLAPNEIEVAMPMAAACLSANELAAAKAALLSIKRESQGSVQYHQLAAQVFLRTGEKDTALKEMGSAVGIEPQNPLLLLQLGRLYQKSGQQDKALQVLEKAASLDPNLPDIAYSMAVTYITEENEPKAIELLSRALKLKPDFDRALFLLGSIHLAADRLDEADGPLADALRLQPRNPFYLCFVGMLRIRQLRTKEAEKEFLQAEAIDPSYALPHFHLGRLLARTSRRAEAETELETSVALQPDLAEAYYDLGLLLHKLGKQEQSDQALAHFRSLRSAAESERAIVLKELQETIR